jgi:hypothetical protein
MGTFVQFQDENSEHFCPLYLGIRVAMLKNAVSLGWKQFTHIERKQQDQLQQWTLVSMDADTI